MSTVPTGLEVGGFKSHFGHELLRKKIPPQKKLLEIGSYSLSFHILGHYGSFRVILGPMY